MSGIHACRLAKGRTLYIPSVNKIIMEKIVKYLTFNLEVNKNTLYNSKPRLTLQKQLSRWNNVKSEAFCGANWHCRRGQSME